MKYANFQTFKGHQICIATVETETAIDNPFWVEVPGSEDPILCELVDGKFVKLTHEEYESLAKE